MVQRFGVFLVRVDPAHIDLGLVHRLRHVGLDSRQEVLALLLVQGPARVDISSAGVCLFDGLFRGRQWPGAHQGLIEQVFLVGVGNRASVAQGLSFPAIAAPPAQHLGGP